MYCLRDRRVAWLPRPTCRFAYFPEWFAEYSAHGNFVVKFRSYSGAPLYLRLFCYSINFSWNSILAKRSDWGICLGRDKKHSVNDIRLYSNLVFVFVFLYFFPIVRSHFLLVFLNVYQPVHVMKIPIYMVGCTWIHPV